MAISDFAKSKSQSWTVRYEVTQCSCQSAWGLENETGHVNKWLSFFFFFFLMEWPTYEFSSLAGTRVHSSEHLVLRDDTEQMAKYEVSGELPWLTEAAEGARETAAARAGSRSERFSITRRVPSWEAPVPWSPACKEYCCDLFCRCNADMPKFNMSSHALITTRCIPWIRHKICVVCYM